ncbi:hypothetical protein R2B70_10140 [Aeromonas sp. XH]|uniref:hypothetical protein n=1 Tax=Aeromonas sp. XH TaxID=3081770 RepID=UPI002967618C|nr:hypothetical protein [Aeromonas sp. XH]WOX46609.1 hypothetical protein R2B70_10140 [Aeromonas sp. XH]
MPISTALPYCVKWESSTLGGCAVDCKGVCVEFPANGTKGPMETTGGECELGGGDPGGGDTGGGDTGGAPYYYPFKNQISPIGVGGQYQEAATAALKQIDEDLRWTAIKLYGQGEESLATFKTFSRDLTKVTDALTIQSNNAEESGKTQLAIWQTLSRSEDSLLRLTNCVTNPFNNNCGHLAGSGESGGSSSGDTAAIKSMMQTAMGWWGGTPGALSSINYGMSSLSTDVAQLKGMTEYFEKQQVGFQGQMAGDLAAIKDMMKNGQGSDGEGNAGIDYSKMPGAADNPLHVAESKYESTLCQDGDNCAFNLGKINKQYDDKKTELKDKYKAIKDEIAEIFRFQFSGSASVPKCFDMYSFAGKSYSICPDVGAYWELLAAVMMFIFYFIALMMVAKR